MICHNIQLKCKHDSNFQYKKYIRCNRNKITRLSSAAAPKLGKKIYSCNQVQSNNFFFLKKKAIISKQLKVKVPSQAS